MKISRWLAIAASIATVSFPLAKAKKLPGFYVLLPEGQQLQYAARLARPARTDDYFAFHDFANNVGRTRGASGTASNFGKVHAAGVTANNVSRVHAADATASNFSHAAAPDATAPKPVVTVESPGGLMKPFSTQPPSNLFQRNPGLASLAPIINVKQELLGARAIPTNKWWGNLIHTTATDNGVHSNPAWANPYALKLPVGVEGPYGIQACYSYTYRKKGELSNNRIKAYWHEFHSDVTLSAAEFTTVPTYEVYDWTDMGVNLKVCSGANCMDSALVAGMAFVSAEYQGLTPFIFSNSEVIWFEQAQNKYVIYLSNKQVWVMYTNSPGTFRLDGSIVKATAPYWGTIRLAVIPPGASTDVYNEFAGCVVHGGVVSAESRTTYTFNWQTNGTSCGTGGLLHFALEHHLDSLVDSKVTKAAIWLASTTRGLMSGIVAKATGGVAQWELHHL